MHCCSKMQCRLRGKVDTNGAVSALLEERLAEGISLLLSAEVSLHYLFPCSIQGPVIDILPYLFNMFNMNESSSLNEDLSIVFPGTQVL